MFSKELHTAQCLHNLIRKHYLSKGDSHEKIRNYIEKSRLESTGQVGCFSDRNSTNICFVTDWNSWIVLMSSCLLTYVNLSTKTDDCRIISEVFLVFFSFLSSYGNQEELIWKFFWDSSENLLEFFWDSSQILLEFFLNSFEILLKFFWNSSGILSEFFWNSFRILLEFF